MNELFKVNSIRSNALKYIVFFTFVGAMMVFLTPMLAEKAEALTRGHVHVFQVVMSHQQYHMEKGVFVETPYFLGTPHTGMTWLSQGSGPFGGTEYGFV